MNYENAIYLLHFGRAPGFAGAAIRSHPCAWEYENRTEGSIFYREEKTEKSENRKQAKKKIYVPAGCPAKLVFKPKTLPFFSGRVFYAGNINFL